MMPAPEIEPLRPDDLPELSRFLVEGFRAPADADFAALDVLRWKYIEPRETGDAPRSFVARDEGGRIVGHVGIVPGRFEGEALAAGPVSTLHMIDWLGAREHRSVGTALMRRAHRGAATPYMRVANDLARGGRGGRGPRPTSA